MIRHHNAMNLTASMMLASERNIIQRFAGLPNAKLLPVANELPGVFIPGARTKGRAVLVAHTDTVWDHKPIRLRYDEDLACFYSGKSKQGIGADDRAGCAALWALRKLGHSLLLVPGEERGCIGSSYVAQHHTDLLADHALAIQFDRRGEDDLVFYDGEPEPLLTTMLPSYPGYAEACGSVSDISVLCPAYGIAGVNVSIGFDYEHTKNEYLNVNAWRRTVECTRAFLSGPTLPDMEYAEAYGSYYGAGFRYWGGEDCDDVADRMGPDEDDVDSPWQDFWCGDCAYSFDSLEVDEFDLDSNALCPVCGGALILLDPAYAR